MSVLDNYAIWTTGIVALPAAGSTTTLSGINPAYPHLILQVELYQDAAGTLATEAQMSQGAMQWFQNSLVQPNADVSIPASTTFFISTVQENQPRLVYAHANCIAVKLEHSVQFNAAITHWRLTATGQLH